MTNAELRALPVGTIIRCDGDDDIGEIIRTGPVVEIMWPNQECSSYIDTDSENWQWLVSNFEVVE